MDIKNISTLIVSAIVSILIVTTIMIPIISSGIENTRVEFNNSDGQYSSLVGEDVTISINSLTYITVNGEQIDLIESYENTVVVTDSLLIKLDSKHNGSYLAYYTEDNGSVRVNNPTSIELAISNNVATITYGNNPTVVDVPFTWGFVADTMGEYRSIWYPYKVYLNNIDQMYGAFWVVSTNIFGSFHGENGIYNGTSIDVDYNIDKVPGTDDIYTLTQSDTDPNLSFVVDNNGSPLTVTPFSCIVPAKIEGDAVGMGVTSVLLSILPVFAILGVLMGVFWSIRRT